MQLRLDKPIACTHKTSLLHYWHDLYCVFRLLFFQKSTFLVKSYLVWVYCRSKFSSGCTFHLWEGVRVFVRNGFLLHPGLVPRFYFWCVPLWLFFVILPFQPITCCCVFTLSPLNSLVAKFNKVWLSQKLCFCLSPVAQSLHLKNMPFCGTCLIAVGFCRTFWFILIWPPLQLEASPNPQRFWLALFQ